jgi:hypothetical protein
MDLSDVLLSDPSAPTPSVMRIGVVTATGPLSVRVGAALTSRLCRRLSSYTPTIGDVVVVLVSGADRIALGTTTT